MDDTLNRLPFANPAPTAQPLAETASPDEFDDQAPVFPQVEPTSSAEPSEVAPREQRSALITGGISATGQAIAAELARRGWNVFLQHTGADTAADDACQTLQKVAQQNHCDVLASAAKADLASPAGREQLVEQVLEDFGQIDLLVNAAGLSSASGADLLEMSEADFRAVLEATLTATLFLTQRVANEMVRLVEAGQIENPKIVTVNTLSASVTSPDLAAHCISRSGLAMMTRLLADRLGEHGINVYEVRTGILAAGPSDPAHARYDSLIAQGLTPIRRFGRPGDVARAVAAIADDLLTFSTGETIHVDGGFHLQRM